MAVNSLYLSNCLSDNNNPYYNYCSYQLTGIEDSLKSLKVLGVRSIDLGKSSNLSFIKAFAEQLTLIAYSRYSDITRGYILRMQSYLMSWLKKIFFMLESY